MIFGKKILTKRKVAWYGDDNYEYTYSNSTKKAIPWTPELLKLKALAVEKTGEEFNSCLLNLYHSGDEGMAYHSDGEKNLKKNGAIASLSFGAERKFSFKHKFTKEKAIKAWDAVWIPAGEPHRLENNTAEMTLILVVAAYPR